MESLITNLQAWLYTKKMCHYDGKVNKIRAKIDPTSIPAGF